MLGVFLYPLTCHSHVRVNHRVNHTSTTRCTMPSMLTVDFSSMHTWSIKRPPTLSIHALDNIYGMSKTILTAETFMLSNHENNRLRIVSLQCCWRAYQLSSNDKHRASYHPSPNVPRLGIRQACRLPSSGHPSRVKHDVPQKHGKYTTDHHWRARGERKSQS